MLPGYHNNVNNENVKRLKEVRVRLEHQKYDDNDEYSNLEFRFPNENSVEFPNQIEFIKKYYSTMVSIYSLFHRLNEYRFTIVSKPNIQM